MSRFGNFWSLIAKNESGGVLILVAFLIVALLGMTALVIDVGYLYQGRRDMVNAADGAALAGAQELIFNDNWGEVESYSENYANSNYDSDIGLVTATVLDSNTIEVITGKTVDFTFARVLGFNSSDVPARAVAINAPLVRMKGLVPVAFREDEYLGSDPGDDADFIEFHVLGPGSWGVVSFEGHGTGQTPFPIADYITNGYPGYVELADPDVYVAVGAAGAGAQPAVRSALEGRIGDEVYVPIVRGSVTGSQWIEVVGFAAVIFDSVTGKGANIAVSGKFIRSVGPGDIDRDAEDFGLKGVALIE